MNKKFSKFLVMSLFLVLTANNVFANTTYLTQSEYRDIVNDNYNEDYGIVVENHPDLGYLKYKNSRGVVKTRNYYADEVVVEKQPYYETEDKIGYLDEMFTNFDFDVRDSEIERIMPGDSIFLRTNKNGEVTYISMYNDYLSRYGKVTKFIYNDGACPQLEIMDEKGNIYVYEVPQATPVSRGKKQVSLSDIKTGDWAKILVSQKIRTRGHMDEQVLEIVLDNNTRDISNIYRGEALSFNTFNQLLNLKNVQALQKNNWSEYKNLVSLSADPKNIEAFKGGLRVTPDYINRYLTNSGEYVYAAVENYKGKESVVKLNFQSKYQSTYAPSTVIAVTATSISLLSGETFSVSEDAILERNNRLVTISDIMVGDILQATVTGENKLAVGRVLNNQLSGNLEVYRGRIQSINEATGLEVETFSLLNDSQWYYHPTPRAFTIDNDTKFYDESGLIEGGVNKFLGYGEESNIGNVYTIIANGGKATHIIEMPYTKQAVQGEIYEVGDNEIKIKDAYYYDETYKRWMEFSKKNVGGSITINANTVIIKDGEVIPARLLEKGDKISAMIEENFNDTDGKANGYILIVEN